MNYNVVECYSPYSQPRLTSDYLCLYNIKLFD